MTSALAAGAFDASVIGGASEPSPTSYDCRNKIEPSLPVILCNVQPTHELLKDVETIPGAIVYTQTGGATGSSVPAGTLLPVAINGLSASLGNIGPAEQ